MILSAPCRLLFALLCILAAPFPAAAKEKTLTLNTADVPPVSCPDGKGIGDRVLAEAGRRLGFELRIVHLPSERALQNANAGIEDGNYVRVAGMTDLYPNLVAVPEPLTRFEFIAITRDLEFPTDGWESLTPYNVGIVTGWKILEQNIADAKSLIRVRDEHALFSMLLAGRIDVAIYDYRQALFHLRAHHPGARVRFLGPPLAVRDMYPYLHRKHAELAPGLAEVLREMKKDGTFRRLEAEALLSAQPIHYGSP